MQDYTMTNYDIDVACHDSISVQKADKPSVCQFFYSGRKKRCGSYGWRRRKRYYERHPFRYGRNSHMAVQKRSQLPYLYIKKEKIISCSISAGSSGSGSFFRYDFLLQAAAAVPFGFRNFWKWFLELYRTIFLLLFWREILYRLFFLQPLQGWQC